MALVLGVIVIVLASWGTGISFAFSAFFLLATIFLEIANSPQQLFLLVSAITVAPLMARFIGQMFSPLFSSQTPTSIVSALTVFFSLAVLSDHQMRSLFSSISRPGSSVSLIGFGGMVAESLYVSCLIAATLLIVTALLEAPFHWFFKSRAQLSINWIAALRPLLLVVVLMGCLSELSELAIESISRGQELLLIERQP